MGSTAKPTLVAPQPSPSTSSSSSSYFVRDCSLGLCSQSCPQLCNYFINIPPPPTDDGSSSRISPLMIALISVLAAAFILLTYYTFTSTYCKRRNRRRRRRQSIDADGFDEVFEEELQDDGRRRLHHLVHGSASNQQPPSSTVRGGGLDDQFIKSIPVFKYRRGDGLVESTECAVCLTEFKEEESLRLMTNCQHAFHLPCIDTWLKSHSSCPICRAPMVLDQVIAATVPSSRPPPTTTSGTTSTSTTVTTVSRHRVDNRGRDLSLSVIIVPDYEGRAEENMERGIRPAVVEIASSDCGDSFRSTVEEDGSGPRKSERGQ